MRWNNVRARMTSPFCEERNRISLPGVDRGLCMCLMLCVSPGEGLNIQYYQIKEPNLKQSSLLLCVLLSFWCVVDNLTREK